MSLSHPSTIPKTTNHFHLFIIQLAKLHAQTKQSLPLSLPSSTFLSITPTTCTAPKAQNALARWVQFPRSKTPLPISYTTTRLKLSDEPVVMLELGSNLNLSAIREGIDVYFECNIKSNPWVYKVSWRHNVSSNQTAIASSGLLRFRSYIKLTTSFLSREERFLY